ncbi:MAG: hypothetical protein RLZZ450_2796, partial [Pseudomonadota bacterium]
DLVARLGGDEFAVLATGDESAAQVLQTRILAAAATARADGATPFELSLSIGMAQHDPAEPRALAQLLSSADRAMYEVKRSRKSAARPR